MSDKPLNIADYAAIRTKKTHKACRHKSIICDDHTRQIECQSCGKILDPFDWIFRQGVEQEKAVFDLQHIRHETQIAMDEFADLSRQKRNLQAQVKRLKEKVKQ